MRAGYLLHGMCWLWCGAGGCGFNVVHWTEFRCLLGSLFLYPCSGMPIAESNWSELEEDTASNSMNGIKNKMK